MNKLVWLSIIFLLVATNSAFAEGDLWDNFGDQNVYGQKAVTDKEFEEALESKKGKPKKQKDKLLRNGESFQQSNETEFLTSMPKELPILIVPLDLELEENKILPIGHYQIMGEKKDNKVYLKFYQAHNLLASIEVVETNDDFGEEELNFVRILDSGNDTVKIIYGSLMFNAHTTLRVAKSADI